MPNHNLEQELRELIRKSKDAPLSKIFDEQDNSKDFEKILGKERVNEIMKEEEVDFEKYFKMASDYFKGIQELASTIDTEQSKLDELLNPSQAHAVGELLMAHLKLEYLVDRIVTDNFKVNNGGNIIGNAKLSFVQKLSLLPVEPGLQKDVVELLREINRLRNAYVHNIKFDIKNFKSKIFDESFKNESSVNEADRFKSIMKLIKGVELILLIQTPSLKIEIENIMMNNPVLKEVAFGLGSGKSKNIHDILLGL